MVVLTSEWPSNSCTVRMSVPDCNKCVAKLWRKVCTDTGLTIPASGTASFKARCSLSSNKWCRRSMPLRGSTDKVGEGNNQHQPQVCAKARVFHLQRIGYLHPGALRLPVGLPQFAGRHHLLA